VTTRDRASLLRNAASWAILARLKPERPPGRLSRMSGESDVARSRGSPVRPRDFHEQRRPPSAETGRHALGRAQVLLPEEGPVLWFGRRSPDRACGHKYKCDDDCRRKAGNGHGVCGLRSPRRRSEPRGTPPHTGGVRKGEGRVRSVEVSPACSDISASRLAHDGNGKKPQGQRFQSLQSSWQGQAPDKLEKEVTPWIPSGTACSSRD